MLAAALVAYAAANPVKRARGVPGGELLFTEPGFTCTLGCPTPAAAVAYLASPLLAGKFQIVG